MQRTGTGRPAPGTKKRDHQDSDATERAAACSSVPEEYWRGVAGPLQVAMVLAARSPMAFVRLAMVSAATATLVLATKGLVQAVAWRLGSLTGHGPAPYETTALVLAGVVTVLGAVVVSTCGDAPAAVPPGA